MYQKHQPMKKERIQGHMKKRETGNLAGILAGAGIMIILAGGLIAFSGPLYKSIAGRNLPVSDVPIYNAGTYEGSARGYGGPITVKAKFSEYGIEDVKVEAPDETPEIGKSAAVRLSKDIWAKQSHSVDSISGATMTSNAVKTAMGACVREAVKEGTELAAIIEQEIAQENAQKALPEVDELLKTIADGSYTYREPEPDENGFYNRIDIEVKDNKITALTWDAVQEDGTGKREMSAGGQYTMTESGPLWYEQADQLARYVMEDENGFCDQITMSVKDHKITALQWDAVDKEGTGKRKLSEDGQYVMTENGPLWFEQADMLAEYLIENQSEEGLLQETGYASDAVASVSIYAGGFLSAVKQCLLNGPE